MLLTDEQKEAAASLYESLLTATNVGLLDILYGELANPDSINDVCDSLSTLIKQQETK